MWQRDNRWCLICNPKNRTIYFHEDPETKDIWLYCNKCSRAYTLIDYCYKAGIQLKDFLKGDISIEQDRPDEVQVMSWPARFLPLSDPRSKLGTDYIKSRGLRLDGDMYYDVERNGIVFPYYFGGYFCGAQTRFIVPRDLGDGEFQKVDTMPGTRLGLLFYGWNQERFIGNAKAVVVAEGAFNAISIAQSLNEVYGGVSNNTWRAIACSGANASEHHKEALKELKDQGYKIIVAPDSDSAGLKMLNKFIESDTATHFALTEDDEKDWNDMLKEKGHKEFAKWFISQITKINKPLN